MITHTSGALQNQFGGDYGARCIEINTRCTGIRLVSFLFVSLEPYGYFKTQPNLYNGENYDKSQTRAVVRKKPSVTSKDYDNCFYQNSPAYRKAHSCETTSINLVEDWRLARDQRQLVSHDTFNRYVKGI